MQSLSETNSSPESKNFDVNEIGFQSWLKYFFQQSPPLTKMEEQQEAKDDESMNSRDAVSTNGIHQYIEEGNETFLLLRSPCFSLALYFSSTQKNNILKTKLIFYICMAFQHIFACRVWLNFSHLSFRILKQN